MKTNLPLFLTINMFILLLSCASLNQNPSKEAIAKVIKAKIDSRNYIIDIGLNTYEDYESILLPKTRGYIHIIGDSLISCMSYDNPYKEDFPPKNYANQMQSMKYKIFDYKERKYSRGRIEISFWFNIDYSGQDISLYDQAKYPEGIIPIHYKLIIAIPTRFAFTEIIMQVTSEL